MRNQDLPSNYFDNLSDKLFEKFELLDDNVEVEAPILFGQNKNDIYSVPNNYFENNEKRFLNKINRRRGSFKIGARVLSIAASFLLLISISWFGFKLFDQEDTEIIEEATFLSYLIDNDEELEADIILSLDDMYLEDSEVDLEDISNAELQEYLDRNVDEISMNDLIILEI